MWLLNSATRERIEQAQSAGLLPTVAQQAEYSARYGYDPTAPSGLLTIAGDVAEIRVSGAITKTPSIMAMLFGDGNVTYPEIIQALAEADANPEVQRAEMRVDSPGGHFDGLFDTLASIQSFSKPLTAVVNNQASSAAYALVSQCDSITASNRAARVGSIGVVAAFSVDPDRVEIASTNAPKKRPDINTDAGQAVIREELDAMHELFVDAIATGRRTTIEKINAEYGQGATLMADEALKRGMIDNIAGAKLRAVALTAETLNHSANTGGDQLEIGMDLKTLKAQHPDVYEAARAEGITHERDRATSHLVAGTAAGMIDEAIQAVESGAEMNSTMTMKYTMAAVNRRDQQNRTDDEANTAQAAAAAAAEGAEDGAEAVLALVEQSLGLSAGGA